MDPARIQQPWARASASNGAVVGPGIGRAEARKPASVPAVLDVLGQDDQVGAGGGLVGQRGRPRDVVVDVVARLELDERDAQGGHGPMVRPAPAARAV